MSVISLLPVVLTYFLFLLPQNIQEMRYYANRAILSEITCVFPSVAPVDEDYEYFALNIKSSTR